MILLHGTPIRPPDSPPNMKQCKNCDTQNMKKNKFCEKCSRCLDCGELIYHQPSHFCNVQNNKE